MSKIRLIDGSELELDLTNPEISAHFADTRNCTREILEQFQNGYYDSMISKDDKTFLDIGANIGLFSIHVSPYSKMTTSVEPTPSHFSILKRMTARFPYIKPVNAALSDKIGMTTFYTCPSNSTMNSLINRGGESFQVSALSLSFLSRQMKSETIDFCKIDIEGSELTALTEQNIKENSDRIKKIFVEFHEVNGVGYSANREKYVPFFKNCGYAVKEIGPDALFAWHLP